MYSNILVPLDGSSLAEKILPHVKEIARLTNGTITLLSVAYAHTSADRFHGADTEVHKLEAKDSAEKYLDSIKHALDGEGFKVKGQVCYGHPTSEILDYSERKEVDLVAMSTHGRTGLGRLTMGSVAEGVLRHATKPILVIRA